MRPRPLASLVERADGLSSGRAKVTPTVAEAGAGRHRHALHGLAVRAGAGAVSSKRLTRRSKPPPAAAGARKMMPGQALVQHAVLHVGHDGGAVVARQQRDELAAPARPPVARRQRLEQQRRRFAQHRWSPVWWPK